MTSAHDTSNTDTIQLHRNSAPSKVKLMIHHQFSGVELLSPLCYSNGATCCLSPEQRIDANSTMQIDFNVDPAREESIGVLMYKLQRKNTDQSDEDKATCIQFVIIWKANNSEGFRLVSRLIEHDKSHVLDRNELMKLIRYHKVFNIQHEPVEKTWLIHDNVVLMTRVNITYEEECYKLEITISEGNMKDDTQRPLCIDMDK
jgi:hypothetical protein